MPFTATDESARAAAPTPTFTRAFVLLNENAGSVQPGDGEKLHALLKELGVPDVRALELRPGRRVDFGAAGARDVAIVLGGDGTARAAAAAAMRPGAPALILLPGGTLNVLPKALYGELAWPEALKAALERGRERRLVAGLANGRPFFVAAAFGAPTLLARAREAVRKGRVREALGRFRYFLLRGLSRRVRARADGRKLRKADAIGVLCPAFSGQIEGAKLEWVRFEARYMHDVVRVGLRALMANWREDASVEIEACDHGDIVSAGAVPAVLDGEPRMFYSRVRVAMSHNGPRVIALDAE